MPAEPLPGGSNSASTELPCDPSSAAGARAFIRQLLAAWHREDPDDVAVLLTSEVVSNAVRHASGDVGLEASLVSGSLLRVAVADASSHLPGVVDPGADAAGGRGLMLVDTLAHRWGTERTHGGKVVWFEVEARLRSNGQGPHPG